MRIAGAGIGFSGLLLAAVTAAAAPVEKLDLRPPNIAVKPICVSKERIDDVRKRWDAWNEKAGRDVKVEDLRSAAQRLAAYDAKTNFDVAEKLLRHLQRNRDATVSARAGSDLVKLYIEANRLDRSNAKQLLPLIEKGPLAGSSNNLYLDGLVYEQGQAVDRDLGKAFDRHMASAQAKNPDALLKLVKLKQADVPQAQNVDVPLTMTLAVNAILAGQSPEICDHIKRVARLFSKGEYIEQNEESAAAWLKLAADFGDADSAWNLARMHLRSELIVKDNAILVKYLTLAAERGVVSAMIELAQIYADGSLLDADAAKAEYWYNKAGEEGSTLALVRLAEFYQRAGSADGTLKAEEVLRRIAGAKDAPSHALVSLADIEIGNGGNVDGLALARPLYERAAALGDSDAILTLARLDIATVSDRRSFRRIANTMEDAAATGNSDAMLELSRLYMCHDPQGPDLTRAQAWKAQALAAGNARVELETAVEGEDSDPLHKIALLRSEALSGTSDALAYLVDAYDTGGTAETDTTFWRARLKSDASAMWRYAKIIAGKGGPARASEVRNALEQAAAAGSVTAKIDLAKFLLSGAPADGEAKATALLVETARAGRGESMELLLERMGEAEFRALYEREHLAQATNARGDYRAFIIAARMSAAQQEHRGNLAAAAASIDCTFDGSFRMAQAVRGLDERDSAARWAEVAAGLAGADGSNNFRLARFFGEIDAKAFALRIADLLGRAAQAGHGAATLRLLALVTDPALPSYDPQRAMALVTRLEQGNDAKSLYAAARALRAIAGLALDAGETPDQLLRRAADLGYPPAMREYGLALLRGDSESEIDAPAGALWLERAAHLDDSEAMVELARAYALGFGVDASLPKAKELLKKAASLGNAKATGLLQSLARM